MQGPALHQLLDIPRADVTETGLQTALLCPLTLQSASQGIYQEHDIMKAEIRSAAEHRKESTTVMVSLSWN